MKAYTQSTYPLKNKAPANFKLIVFLLLTCLFFNSCGDDGIEFTGMVVNSSGAAISNAIVKINDNSTETDQNGKFTLDVTKANEYLIGVTHLEYASLFEVSRTPLVDQIYSLPDADVEMVDPTTTITLVDDRPEIDGIIRSGAIFTLPPNSLVDDGGNAPTGLIRGAIATLDLANSEGPRDWGVTLASGDEGFLVSYGAVFLEFTSADGRTEYQLKSGQKGQLSLPVIPSMEAHANTTPNAPFWYYDEENGGWKETGQSIYDPTTGSYKGEIDHLSVINTDIAKTDAACLAVTLDASIAAGHQLRIRYHSGGTPFGQVPVFTMNDPLNAVYRLPANTNVLLELLNSGGTVLSNLVVEDPAGSPLVNTVVNTGPALPSGSSLWPPSPFTPCKPITLSIVTPQVEIRINEQASAILPIDNPNDDYLTWAPTYAMARLASPMASPVNIVLTNDAATSGGDVRFAQHVAPWPINTTATLTTLPLTLPASGAWVPFMIAGEFGSPSTADKDAIVEAHMNTATGTIIGTKAMMVRVRKDGNTLTPGEEGRFLFAWRKFRNKVGGMNFILAQEIHRLSNEAGDESHGQAAFLTWHRVFLLQVERELQMLEPSVALHYWDWDSASPNLFASEFIGEAGSTGFVDEPDFDLTNPLLGWDTDLPYTGGELRRNTSDHTLNPYPTMKPLDHPVDPSLIDRVNYGPNNSFVSFSRDVESSSHNDAHGWPCGLGHLTAPSRSASDPLFYFLHSQIDREWAYWQERHNRHGVVSGGALTFPNPQHYDNAGSWTAASTIQLGSHLEDGIWPWDGTSGTSAGTGLQERPPAIGTGITPANEIPNSTPTIPMSPFPASIHPNLWPATPSIPRNRHMIDYLGRFDIINGLGFCYDDVPY